MFANFPAGLSIFHSYPSTSQFGPYTQAEQLTDILSAEAQDIAIAKYGIAGRVWYIHPLPPLATFHRRESVPQGGGLRNDALPPAFGRV
jgi:hypothetical protein